MKQSAERSDVVKPAPVFLPEHREYDATLKQRTRTTWLSPDDDALVLTVNHHVSVHAVSQGVDVGGVLVLSLGRDVNNGERKRGTLPISGRNVLVHFFQIGVTEAPNV